MKVAELEDFKADLDRKIKAYLAKGSTYQMSNQRDSSSRKIEAVTGED